MGTSDELTEEMIAAGVSALARSCPLPEVFPVGGEEDAVEAVWIAMRAALPAHMRQLYTWVSRMSQLPDARQAGAKLLDEIATQLFDSELNDGDYLRLSRSSSRDLAAFILDALARSASVSSSHRLPSSANCPA